MSTNAISENIVKFRELKGLSQSDLARLMDVSPQAVQKWESGGAPRTAKLGKLAETLEIEVSQLTNCGAGRDSDKYIVRFPDGMHEQIKVRAAGNRRSINAEIIFLLEMSMNGESDSNGSNSTPYNLSSTALLVAREFDSMSDLGKMKVMEAILKVKNGM